MRLQHIAAATALVLASLCPVAIAQTAVAVGPQYDTTHVYIAPQTIDAFVTSFLATFGGTSTKQIIATVTPTSSSTTSQALRTPVGSVSLFGFKTPIPVPFGTERTGYLVTDMNSAIAQARAAGADVLVAPFPDPIGVDAIIQWPGGVNMQLYWHTTPSTYPPLTHIPENRIYLSEDRVALFEKAFLQFSRGAIVSDDPHADGNEIGRANTTVHRIRIESLFGKMIVYATDGHLPFPYGAETTGYEVDDLDITLSRAIAHGATLLIAPFPIDRRRSAMVQFPGGYIAEIHTTPHL